jgi:hypothetical protein
MCRSGGGSSSSGLYGCLARLSGVVLGIGVG